MTHEGLDRLRHSSRYLPLVEAWKLSGSIASPPIAQVEADAVTIVIEALEACRPCVITVPGGRSRLPLLAAAIAAADPLVRPHLGKERGTVAFVTRSAFRRTELEELHVSATPVAAALNARRLRGDGLTCRSGGGGVSELHPENHLLFASPAAGLVAPIGGRVRAVIVDDTDDPEAKLTKLANDWAEELGASIVAFNNLNATPPHGWSSWPIDWPAFVREGLAFGLEGRSTSASGMAQRIVVPDTRVAPLFRARSTLAHLGNRAAPWPGPLAAIARFARILLDLAVPADLYDAHVSGTIARSLTRRRDELDATPPSALDGPWRDVAETDWALLKSDICSVHDALVDINYKANSLGLTVEEQLRGDDAVDVLCPTQVSACATRTWLLQGGFEGCARALEIGRLNVKAIGEPEIWDQRRWTVLPGMVAYRHRKRLSDGDIGRLVVCCYPAEGNNLATHLDGLLNGTQTQCSARRNDTLFNLLGAIGLPTPDPIKISVRSMESKLASELEPADFVDVAEMTALSAELVDELEEESEIGEFLADGNIWVKGRALILEPAGGGSRVGLLVRESSTLDRVIQGRVSAVKPSGLAPGILLVGITGEDRKGIFARLRPHLDVLHGPGTRFWLELWHQTLLQALQRKGGVNALGAALRAKGATVLDSAINTWPSPYRIGPRDPNNIRRVAEVAEVPVVVENSRKVAAIMGAVRQLHREIGARLSTALSAAGAGNNEAFDRLETQLGIGVLELLGDITPWRVEFVSDVGWVRPSSLFRPMLPRLADEAFFPMNL